MSDETITVAEVSGGPGGDDAEPGTPVDLPVVELLTGRGFVTGKSGSGKSNTASVLVERLLDNNFPVLIVDTDGEYYGLKEAYEVLHVGADEECDIQVSPEHAEKIANLALEQNVPIILDVSGYLDESVAKDLLLNTARQLFAKEKKLKKPFLMLVEEVHEYIPEGGGLDETGKMLIKIGKRGRKHGLGIVGISQRPADVKKDYITQCDWLVWHRLTWNNDTNVVGRILGSEYADAIEEMDDGEGFLVTDWSGEVRRVQFHRKETFDAGATPGLEDFERPELKSVSSDLVGELREISEERECRESELADLRQELDAKRQRIDELERELAEARDLSAMADQFAQAMLSKASVSYRDGVGRAVDESDAGAGADRDDNAVTADVTRASADAADDGRQATLAGDDGAATGGDSERVARTDGTEVESGGTDRREDARPGARDGDATAGDGADPGTREAVVESLVERVAALGGVEVGMLRYYRDVRLADPVAAHVAAGGDADEAIAYGRNRTLREAGLVEHAGRGRYRYAVPERIVEACGDELGESAFVETVEAVERTFLDRDGAGDAGAPDGTETDAGADADADAEADTGGPEGGRTRPRSADANGRSDGGRR